MDIVNDNTKTLTRKKGKATILSKRVAEILMEMRQSRQMSQRAFAEHIGVSFQQYQKYEKGRDRISLEKAILLCSQLGIPLDIFMEDEADSSVGFAESEQQAFGQPAKIPPAPVLGKDEKAVLDILAEIPESARHDFLETLRQLAKITVKKS